MGSNIYPGSEDDEVLIVRGCLPHQIYPLNGGGTIVVTFLGHLTSRGSVSPPLVLAHLLLLTYLIFPEQGCQDQIDSGGISSKPCQSEVTS